MINSRVIGLHGTSLTVAERVAAGEPFQFSVQPTDWLGTGAYFFEDFAGQRVDAETRAWAWARRHHAVEPAVVRVETDEDGLLDLWNDEDAQRYVHDVWQQLRSRTDLPKQTIGRGAYFLDRIVIDEAADRLGDIKVVRGLLDEIPPIFLGTALLRDPHIQVAVRDITAIRAVTISRRR